MRRNPLFAAYAGPGALTFAGIVVVLARPHSPWSFILLGLALLTAPLWPWRAIESHQGSDQRSDLVEALNFQLTMIAVIIVGAILILGFIGLPIVVIAVFIQLLVNFTAAWRIRSGEPVALPRKPIQFVK